MEQRFPDVGEGLTEGVLAKWLVAIGETIKNDQMIARVSTDKSVVDIPSSIEGVVTELLADEGDTINVGDVIMRTDSAAPVESARTPQAPTAEQADTPPRERERNDTPATREAAQARPEAEEATAPKGEPEAAPHAEEPEELPDAGHISPTKRLAANIPQREDFEKPRPSGADAHTRAPKSSSNDVLALPNVRHYAREHHLDLATIEGSGPDGRIILNDLSTRSHDEVETHTNREKSTPRVQKDVLASPSIRRYAREQNVDISAISGTGTHSHITRDDVDGARRKARIAAPVPREIPPSQAVGTSEPLSPIRKIISERMMASLASNAQVTHTDRADVTTLVELRDRVRDHAQAHGAKITYLPFFIKAVVAALKAYPRFNASLENDTVTTYGEYHIGIAADTERGLIVPVIRNAQSKSIIELAKELHDLAAAARDGTLTPEQMRGATFTITSVGNLGGEAFTPIINSPNTAILGIGAIKKLPHVVSGEIAVRDIVIFSLTYDHRIIDGADAARFVSMLVDLCEVPEHLLIEGV